MTRRVFKRWLVRVTYFWWGEQTADELVATADFKTMLNIWDPFQDPVEQVPLSLVQWDIRAEEASKGAA